MKREAKTQKEAKGEKGGKVQNQGEKTKIGKVKDEEGEGGRKGRSGG